MSIDSRQNRTLISLADIIKNELKDDPDNTINAGEQADLETSSSKFYAVLRNVVHQNRPTEDTPSRVRSKKEYMLVRIKKMNYRRKRSVAVFFQNMTKHVE